MLKPTEIKQDFPLLSRKVHGKPLVYLDSAATSQKPRQVIEAISKYYQHSNANVHRGVHQLSDESTTAWEESREVISSFFSTQPEELILTRNTTEALNGVAYGWADNNLGAGDIILTSPLEHHSSLVVWQEVCRRTGCSLRFLEIDRFGRINLEVLGGKVKLVALTHISNTLGTVLPVQEVVEVVRKNFGSSTRILLDAAQSAPHMKLDFRKMGVDFMVFSGHKMLGPMGTGGLLVRKSLLESGEMRPWLFGGGMISKVSTDNTEYHPDITERFTAGTPDVAGAVGLAAACEYLSSIGIEEVEQHDREITQYALDKLSAVAELEILGPVESQGSQLDRLGSVTFLYKGVHAHDVAQILDSQGIAVRSGHHCTMPLHTQFGWQASIRASFQVYTTHEDIDRLIYGLGKVKEVFSHV